MLKHWINYKSIIIVDKDKFNMIIHIAFYETTGSITKIVAQ